MRIIYGYIITALFCFNVADLSAQSFNIAKIDASLCKIYDDDQQVRLKMVEATASNDRSIISINRKMKSIDSKNQKQVSKILDKYGWPDGFSENANKAIFLVIQHSDKSFSEKYFNLVKDKADKGVIAKSDVATLEDRILMWSSREQKYGTQTVAVGDVFYIWPIEDSDMVNILRKSVGLSPMSAQIERLEKQIKRKIIWDKTLLVRDLNANF